MSTKYRWAWVAGFTFIEMLLALLMVAVLISLSAPPYQSMIIKQKLRATSSDIRAALMLTRSEAILTAKAAILQPKEAEWDNGWEVISDGHVVGDFSLNKHVHVEGPLHVRYSSWGRNTRNACQSFSLTHNECSLCIYLEPDGSTFVETGECASQCPEKPNQKKVWHSACK